MMLIFYYIPYISQSFSLHHKPLSLPPSLSSLSLYLSLLPLFSLFSISLSSLSLSLCLLHHFPVSPLFARTIKESDCRKTVLNTFPLILLSNPLPLSFSLSLSLSRCLGHSVSVRLSVPSFVFLFCFTVSVPPSLFLCL